MEDHRRQLDPLARGIWGASAAWVLVLAGIWVFLHFRQPNGMRPAELLPEFYGAYEDTTPQKVFYISFFTVGLAGAYLAVRFVKPAYLAVPWTWAGVVGFVPVGAFGLHRIVQRDFNLLWLLAPAVCVGGPLLMSRRGNGPAWADRSGTDPERTGATPAPAADCAAPGPRRGRGFSLDLAAWLVFAILLCPSSVGALAGQAALDMHPVCYLIGPATYFRGDGLVPGRDYFTQYGIGPGFVFSRFLGDGAQATLENYIRFLVALIWVFFGTAYLILRQWFGARSWAFGTALTGLLLNFCGLTPFNWPSSWVVRYPLLFVFIWLMARALTRGGAVRCVLAGGCAGLALFWNTETGLYLTAAGAAAQVLLWPGWTRAGRDGLSFLTAAAAGFFGVSALVYGSAVFSRDFLEGLVKPLLLYGEGLGGIRIDGRPGWSYLDVVIGPVLLTATAAWCVAGWRATSDPARRRFLAFLLLLALLGECLLLKWVNRALLVVWNVNALPTFAVMAWWLRCAYQQATARQPATGRRLLWKPDRAAALGITALACTFLLGVRDFRWRFPLAGRSYARYPGLVRAAMTGRWPVGWPAGLGEVAGRDIDLIRQWTRPGERAAVVSRLDWVYLVAARRAPKLHVVPSAWVFLDWQIERSLEGADRIFVEVDAGGRPVLPPITFGDRLAALLEREYTVRAVGTNLALYVRR
jgi:hypothetical protein